MHNEIVQRLVDIEEIKQLKARYCMCVAKEDWQTFETLFAEDLQFITTDGTIHEPRSGFMAFHKKNIQQAKLWGVIHCYTPLITLTGANTATGIWAMEDFHVWPGTEGHRVGHHAYGHYHEEYVRLPDGWRFKQIKVVTDRMYPLEGGFGGKAK
jgi:uncharacterized protein (TIGR02246 family)